MVQASHGKTFNTESMNARRENETWIPGPDSLCVSLYVPAPLSVSLQVNERDMIMMMIILTLILLVTALIVFLYHVLCCVLEALLTLYMYYLI